MKGLSSVSFVALIGSSVTVRHREDLGWDPRGFLAIFHMAKVVFSMGKREATDFYFLYISMVASRRFSQPNPVFEEISVLSIGNFIGHWCIEMYS